MLISIDSLRADRLGVYGAERDTSPAIDALAARGVRFENAVAPTSWTLPSHVTLFTGLPIPAHRVDEAEDRIDPSRHLLAEHLSKLGYRTAAFVSAPFFHRSYGFARGFDTYENFQSVKELTIPPSRALHEHSHLDETAPEVIDASLDWLDALPAGDGRPWFLFVHLWDVHYDFLPPPPYDRMFDPDYAGDLDPRGFEQNPAINKHMDPRDLEHLKALYDGEVRWTDSQLARLLDALDRRPEGRIVISLVADHGDEFFEHGEKGHFRALYEESVHVPWILVDPGRLAPGRTIATPVGLGDVAPTLLGLAGLPPLPEAVGRDLAPFLLGGPAPPGDVLLNLRQHRALRGDGWKVIHDAATGYAVHYDLRGDPGEHDPQPARRVAPERLESLDRLQAEAEALGDSLPWTGTESPQIDPEVQARLRELGYVD